MELRAASIIDTKLEGHYAFYPFVEAISTRLHYHDFYEVFLITEGSIDHHINGICQHLDSGTLVLIRPSDSHYFSKYSNDECKLVNLAFLNQVFDAVMLFLGLQGVTLNSAPYPPTIPLNLRDRKIAQTQLQDWGRMHRTDKEAARRELRVLLADLIHRFFVSPQAQQRAAIPAWLHELQLEMQRPEHFIEGRGALLRLAKRTPEYVGRVFREHLDLTPSQFINDLRLNYAHDLLLETDLTPTEIAYEVGFGNLSHFYHLFKARWGCSPNQYRYQHQQTLVP